MAVEKQTGTQVKWRKFVDEFMSNGFDRTQAAIAAGYEKDSASSCADYLLKKPEIQRMIRYRQGLAAQKYAITTDMLMEQFEDAYIIAKESHNVPGMIDATVKMGKLAGFVLDDSKVTLGGKVDHEVMDKHPDVEERLKRLAGATTSTRSGSICTTLSTGFCSTRSPADR